MSREEALDIIKSGNTGAEILSLLEKVSSLCTVSNETDSEFSDVEFDD
jgi:hypothetical protein